MKKTSTNTTLLYGFAGLAGLALAVSLIPNNSGAPTDTSGGGSNSPSQGSNGSSGGGIGGAIDSLLGLLRKPFRFTDVNCDIAPREMVFIHEKRSYKISYDWAAARVALNNGAPFALAAVPTILVTVTPDELLLFDTQANKTISVNIKNCKIKN